VVYKSLRTTGLPWRTELRGFFYPNKKLATFSVFILMVSLVLVGVFGGFSRDILHFKKEFLVLVYELNTH
jgi:hypothetical protein